jgi:hypothetical protein
MLAAQTGATLKELMTRLGHSTPRAGPDLPDATGECDKKIADGLNPYIRQYGSRDLARCVDHGSDLRSGHLNVSRRFVLDRVVMCP